MSFPPATVIAPPGILTGTGRATVNGATVCVQGDEASAMVAGAAYFTPAFPTPGVGILTITGLAPDQVSTKGSSGGRPIVLRGSQYRAQLQVVAPATNPGTGAPDPVPIYSGSGSFMTVNTKAQAG